MDRATSAAVAVLLFPPIGFGMWWLYFRLVPRISAWLLKKMGIE